MDIAIIVSTYNRCQSLKDTIHALVNQKVNDGIVVEIFIIDNNSSDQTKEVVLQSVTKSKFPIHYFFEPKQGISHARNRGINEASSKYILFTDDDVIPELNWLQAIYDAFESQQADVVGGKILPLYSGPLPLWAQQENVLRVLWGILALLDLGDKSFVINDMERNTFYGANFAFRREGLTELGAFRTDLGLVGNVRLLGEDSEILERFFRAGKKLWYEAKAVVMHKVPVARIDMKYVREWRYKKGYSVTQQKLLGKKMILPELWVIRECLGNAIAMSWFWLMRDSKTTLNHELQFWTQWGLIAGCFHGLKRGNY